MRLRSSLRHYFLPCSLGQLAAQARDVAAVYQASCASCHAQPAPDSRTPEAVPGVGTIVTEMPKDLRRFLSVDTAIVLGAGGAAAGIAHIWDDDLKQEVETNVQLNDALQPGNTSGSFPFQVVMVSDCTRSVACSTPPRSV